MVPLLANKDADWPHVSITYLSEPGSYGLSTERWRYIHYAGGDEELYDSDADRYEWTNLAGQADHAAKLDELRALAPRTFAPRVPPKDKSLPKLKWHPAVDSPTPASNPDGDPFDVVFLNQREDPVNLFWMDRKGEPKPYGSIASGWHIHQNTRPGAVWQITDSMNRSLGYFVVGDRSALAAIPDDK